MKWRRVGQIERGFWLAAIGLTVLFGSAYLLQVAAESGAAPPVALSAELRSRLKEERLQIVTSLRGMPLGVRMELQALFRGSTLDIADPGADFQDGDAADDSDLPTRRLVAAGCSYEYCLVYYERGGAGRTHRVALFHWTPDQTRFEFGGIAPDGLTTVDDVRSAALSGSIDEAGGLW
jgi:hypothetical protein